MPRSQLVPRPERAAIALLSFDDVYAAADAVPALLEQEPDGIEGFDDKLYDAVRKIAPAGGLDAFPAGRGFLIVEAGGDSREEAEANVRRMVEARDTWRRLHVVTDPARAGAHMGSARGGAWSHRFRSRPARALAGLGRQRRSAGQARRLPPRSRRSCSRSTVIPPRCTAISATA